MYLVANVGGTGSGKSTLLKKMMSQRSIGKIFIFDVQNEYEDIPPYKGEILPKMRFIGMNIEGFIDVVKKLPKGYWIFIEEATGFFRGRSSKDFINIILSKRHIKQNFVLNFHTLHRIPIDIVEFTDIIYLRKTLDIEDNIKKKFPNILETWKSIKRSPDPYEMRALYMSNLTEKFRR